MHRQAPGPYAPSRGYKNLRVEDPPTYFVKNRNGNRVNCWEPDPQAIPVEYSNSQNYFPKVNSPYGNAGYKSRSVNGQVTSRNYGEPLRSPNYQGYNKNKMFPWTNWKVKETSDALDRTGWVPRSSSPQKVYRKGYQDKNRGITSASKNLAPETNSNLVSIHGNENKMEVDPKEIQEYVVTN
ncbi:hypothetical protein HMI54_002825 [Coelomomyces lativittatus]|nr:hypothetical protein HMI55_005536 [Coelomomyces lativittatus]KAJ1508910.1 hypothetical protein HMI54_002825 [Coelomomyces lativittatus]KAJ1510560.1 hypothetical protein HMI56_006280 [Coelomomyces lativittatus]